jgi:hypothetical protein
MAFDLDAHKQHVAALAVKIIETWHTHIGTDRPDVPHKSVLLDAFAAVAGKILEDAPLRVVHGHMGTILDEISDAQAVTMERELATLDEADATLDKRTNH